VTMGMINYNIILIGMINSNIILIILLF